MIQADSRGVPTLSNIKSKDISRLSFTAGVTVNEEAGKQDSVVEQYLRPRPPPPLAARRAASLPLASPHLGDPPTRGEVDTRRSAVVVVVVGRRVG